LGNCWPFHEPLTPHLWENSFTNEAVCNVPKPCGSLPTEIPNMQLSDLTWPRVQALSKDMPVIIPVAALEQHGHHLPLFTDSLLLGEIVRRVADNLSDRVLFAPLTWLGNSDHHLDFAGTLSAAPRVYIDLLSGLAENFITHGFKRIVFLNGHGGNDVPGRQAIFEVRQRHRQRADLLLLFATYWNLAADPSTAEPSLVQRHMGHACEWETSMILRLAPHLVGDVSKLDPVPPGSVFDPAARAWITQDRTAPGHIGDPRAATAEKGEALFQAFAAGAMSMIERVLAWDGNSWNP
jgi:creatinine amidohydrolase